MAKRISVLIPICNSGEFLEEAVASMLAQTLHELEVILVDDGSTDSSRALILRLAAQDSRIRTLLFDQNQGMPGALNRGLALCAGDWIARLDADDVSLPERLERQLAFADEHPDAVLIGSDIHFIDARSRIVGRNLKLPTAHEEIDLALLWGQWPIVHSTVIIRRDALQALGGYNEQFRTNSDHELFLRLAERGRLYSIPERLTFYRLHPAQITQWTASGSHVETIVRLACSRRGIAVTHPPLSVRLREMGVSYVRDLLVYRDRTGPLRYLAGNLRRPGAWYRSAAAYLGFAFWGPVRAVQRLFAKNRAA